jgi:UDP-glucuronate 4-epimerase
LNILVTGGAGFIGSNLVDKLLEEKHQITVVDNFDPYYDPKLKENNIFTALDNSDYKLYRCDILNQDELKKIFKDNEFEIIIHLAAKVGVRNSLINPKEYYKTNVEGTLNILEECRNNNINKILFASSSSVYGNNKKVPFSETDNVDYPISPYAATKKAGELICYNYHHLYNMNIFCFRFFTVYGRRGRPEMAIPKFTKMIDNGDEIPVYGNGDPRRDYTFIDDIIQGLQKAVNLVNGYEIINLGESNTISVNEMIQLIENGLGKKAIRNMLPMQPGDVNETYADIRKAKKILDYIPSTQIHKGIQKYFDWYLGQ